MGLLNWLRYFRKDKDEGAPASLGDNHELSSQLDQACVSPSQKILIENIVKVKNLCVSDIQVPRAKIEAVDQKTDLRELIDIMLKKSHSRLPVYGENMDDVLGMVYIKDVLECYHKKQDTQSFRLHSILRDILFVSPSMCALDLMHEMRIKKRHMALVVDEYGGIDGLVTIEDLVEQIVGEIEDEHDPEAEIECVEFKEGSYRVDARMPLDDFAQILGYAPWKNEPEIENIDTLGGLVFFLSGYVPSLGECIFYSQLGLKFEILDVEPRCIRYLRVDVIKNKSK